MLEVNSSLELMSEREIKLAANEETSLVVENSDGTLVIWDVDAFDEEVAIETSEGRAGLSSYNDAGIGLSS